MFEKDCPVPETFRSMLWNVLFLAVLFFLTFIARFIFSPLVFFLCLIEHMEEGC